MSRYFPHTSYAEDQPLARTILTTHVVTRALTTGSVIGGGLFAYRAIRGKIPVVAATTTTTAALSSATAMTTITPLLRFGVSFLRTTAISSLWAIGLTSAALAARMQGREDIEWRDRAWRLLENRGQVETDDWTYGGMVAGVAAYAAAVVATATASTATTATTMTKSPLLLLSKAGKAGGARGRVVTGLVLGVLGSAGAGSVFGTLGYMGWRYGVNGGRFPDVDVKGEVVGEGEGVKEVVR